MGIAQLDASQTTFNGSAAWVVDSFTDKVMHGLGMCGVCNGICVVGGGTRASTVCNGMARPLGGDQCRQKVHRLGMGGMAEQKGVHVPSTGDAAAPACKG